MKKRGIQVPKEITNQAFWLANDQRHPQTANQVRGHRGANPSRCEAGFCRPHWIFKTGVLSYSWERRVKTDVSRIPWHQRKIASLKWVVFHSKGIDHKRRMPCKYSKGRHCLSVGWPWLYGALVDSFLHVNNTHVSLYFQFPLWSRIFCPWGSHCLSGKRLAYG